MTAAHQFATWSNELRLDDVAPGVQHAACRHLLDGFGTAQAAARTHSVDYVIDVATGLGSSLEAGIIAFPHTVSAAAAALANGVLVHALDFDDTHPRALVHATSIVLPAAVAAGHSSNASGAEVLTAAIAGYEMIARLGMAVPHAFHQRGLHATSVCGVFAAALIASKLWGLNTDQTTCAIGIAGSMASGSLEFLNTGANTKQLHPGMAAMSGLLAARLAERGAIGPDSILEGEHGLYASLANATVGGDQLVSGLGSVWETTQITIKPYPVCQLSHASLDALTLLLENNAWPEVAEIVFDVPSGAVPIVCEPSESKGRPRTSYEAKFSLPWCAALVAVDHSLSVDSFDDLERLDVMRVAERVQCRSVETDEPPATAPGVVKVVTSDGRRLSETVATSRGGHGAPLSDVELISKATANGASERLCDLVMNLTEQKALDEIMAATR